MKPLISATPKALTIDINLLTINEIQNILKRNQGYVDSKRQQLIVWGKK